MKDDTALDYAQFSLSSSFPSRCKFLVSAGGANEIILSGGCCKSFVAHLQALQEDGTVRLELKRDPAGSRNERTWFTKGTLERFARFVLQPEVLERVKSIEEEVTQLEQVRNIQVEDELLHPRSITLDDKVVLSRLQAKNGAHTQSRQWLGGEIDSVTKAPKKQLLRAMDARVHALRLEQETAFACARAAGYDDAGIEDLLSFADYFGANRLWEACVQFSSLLRKTAIAVADEEETLVQHNHARKLSIGTTIVHISHFKNNFCEEEEEKEESGEVYTRMAGKIDPSPQHIPLPKLESLEDAESPHESFQSNYCSGHGCKANDSVAKMEIIGLEVDKTIGEERVSITAWESSCLPSNSRRERSKESWGSPLHHSFDIQALVGMVDIAIGNRSQDSRGRLYEQYRKLRDVKLREDASKREEREAKLKAMEETLDRRKAEMETRNARPSPKRNNSRFMQRVPLPQAEKSLVAQDVLSEDDRKGRRAQEPKEGQSNGYSRSCSPVSLDSLGIKEQSPTERSGNSAKKPVSVLSPKPPGQKVQEPKKEQSNGHSKSSSPVLVVSSGIKVQSPSERSGNSAKKYVPVLSPKPPVTSSTASPKQSMKKKLPPIVAEEDPLPCFADSRKEVAKPSLGRTSDVKLPPKLPLRGSSGDSKELRVPSARKSHAALNLTLTLTEVKALPSSEEGGGRVIAATRKKVAAVVVEKPAKLSSSVHGRIRRRNAIAPLQEAAKPFLRKGRGIGPGAGSNVMKLKASVDTAKTSSDEGGLSSTTLSPSVVVKEPGYLDESILIGPPLQPSGLCELDVQREKTNVIHKELPDIASPDQSQEKREKFFPNQLNKGVVSSFIASDSVEVVAASVSFHSSSLPDELGADSTIFASPSTILSGAQSCSIISGSEFCLVSSPTALEDPAHNPTSYCSSLSAAEIACQSKKWIGGGSGGVLNKPAQLAREPVKGFKRFFRFGRKNRPLEAAAAASTATILSVDDESVLSEPSQVNGDGDEQGRKGERQSSDGLLRVCESGTEHGNKSLTLGDLCSIHEQEMGHLLQRSIPGNLKPREDRTSGGSLLKGLSLFKTACFAKHFTNSCYYDFNAS